MIIQYLNSVTRKILQENFITVDISTETLKNFKWVDVNLQNVSKISKFRYDDQVYMKNMHQTNLKILKISECTCCGRSYKFGRK